MNRVTLSAVTLLALSLYGEKVRAESWECGGAKIHCGGSAETCADLKRACTKDIQSSSEVDRELLQAVRQARTGDPSPRSQDPFDRLSRSVAFQDCSEQQAKEGRCGVIYNAKELVSAVVDTLRYSADALNQASHILQGNR
jgi:hypothetical protein